VDVDPASAARGTTRQLYIPADDGPDHKVLSVVIPPGTLDGAMLLVAGAPGGVVRVRVSAGAPGGVVRVRVSAGAPQVGSMPPAAGPATWTRPQQAVYVPTPRRRPVVPILVALLLLIGVGAVVLATRGGDDNPDPIAASASTTSSPTGGSGSDSGTETPTATPSGPKTPTGISPTAYQRALTTFDRGLDGRLRTLRTARTPTTVSSAARALHLALVGQQRSLAALAPPAAIASAHETLVRAVDDLAADAESAQTSAEEHTFCTGAAAADWLSRSPSAQKIRVAAYQVSRVDRAHRYQVGASLPRPRRDQHRRLGRGTVISRSTSGLGTLTVDNGSSSDTVINVVRNGARTPSLSVYSPAKAKFTVGNIGDGNYTIFVASGTDWDGGQSTFTHDCAYERFDQGFPFTTSGNTYTTWSITLQEVIGGNATKSSVDPDAFPHN
jgi:hypothetical protein